MEKHAEETFEVFSIDAERNVLVGESYLVATAYRTFGAYWFGEQYLLLERPAQHLERAAVRFAASGVPEHIAVVDLRFMIEEVKNLARSHFADLLLNRFEKTKNPEILAARFDFKPCDVGALARCWMRNMYHNQIQEVVRTTAVHELVPVLQSFTSLPVFTAK